MRGSHRARPLARWIPLSPMWIAVARSCVSASPQALSLPEMPSTEDSQVHDLDDWSRKCFNLHRVATDQVILNALVNPQAPLSGEATFHLADGCDEGTGRHSGLRPQQDANTGSASLTSLVVKDGVAAVEIEADRRAE
jgi:hypothetical protein